MLARERFCRSLVIIASSAVISPGQGENSGPVTAGRKFRANLRLHAYRRYKTASLKCKGFSLKVKWSHTVSTRSRPICPHEEVGELNPVFQIDPLPAWLRTTRPPSHPVYSMGLSECCSNTFWRAGSFKPHKPPLREVPAAESQHDHS